MSERVSKRVTRACVLAGCLASAAALAAEESSTVTPAHGELAAAVRSAGLPCAHVTGVNALTDDRWSVTCNAGTYTVIRAEDGGLSVAQP